MNDCCRFTNPEIQISISGDQVLFLASEPSREQANSDGFRASEVQIGFVRISSSFVKNHNKIKKFEFKTAEVHYHATLSSQLVRFEFDLFCSWIDSTFLSIRD